MSLISLLRRGRPVVAMERHHWPAVLTIDGATFNRPLQSCHLQAWQANPCVGCHVVECGADVLGYLIYGIGRRRLEILRLAVRDDHRRTGLGRGLLAAPCLWLGRQRVVAVCDVSERDLTAGPCHFLTACGWRLLGRRPEAGTEREDVFRFAIYAKEVSHAEV